MRENYNPPDSLDLKLGEVFMYRGIKMDLALGLTIEDYIKELKEIYSKSTYYRKKKRALELYDLIKNN